MSITQSFEMPIPFFVYHMGKTKEASESVQQFIDNNTDLTSYDHWAEFTTNVKTLDRFLPQDIEAEICQVAESILTLYTERTPKFSYHYWFNLYNKGQYQEAHDHVPKQLSAVWYIKGNAENTTFLNPNHFWPFSKNSFTPNAKEGDVIFFPSGLVHQVLPAKEDGRLTIAFDFFNVQF